MTKQGDEKKIYKITIQQTLAIGVDVTIEIRGINDTKQVAPIVLNYCSSTHFKPGTGVLVSLVGDGKILFCNAPPANIIRACSQRTLIEQMV